MAENDHDSSSSLLSLLLGLGVGFGIALLFAPRSGEETRELISEKAKEGVDCATEAVQELKAQVEMGICSAGEAAQELKGQIEETVASFKDRVQQAVRAGQEAYREEIEETKEREAPQGPSTQSASSGS